jgi:hypothetical protein
MKQMLERIMNRYGTRIRWTHGVESREFRAFFQPVRSKSWQYLEGDYSPLGEIPRGQYVYIGPAEPGAEAGDTITVEGKAYWIRRSEQILDGNGPVYCWGMCVEKGGEDTWGQS